MEGGGSLGPYSKNDLKTDRIKVEGRGNNDHTSSTRKEAFHEKRSVWDDKTVNI